VRTRGFAQHGRHRTPAGLGLESEPSSGRVKARQVGSAHQREKKGEGRRKQATRGRWAGGELLGRTEEKERGEGKEARELGCAGRERGSEAGPTRPCGRGRKGRAFQLEKEREK
jgi:hypothetical protein